VLGLNDDQISQLQRNAVQMSFLSEQEKKVLMNIKQSK